jgi:hypothetical protein
VFQVDEIRPTDTRDKRTRVGVEELDHFPDRAPSSFGEVVVAAPANEHKEA